MNHVHDELTLPNATAFDAMNLYLIERPGVRDELIHVSFRPDGALDRADIADYGLMLGHYSRFVLPGSVRLKTECSDPRVRVTAFSLPTGRPAIVLINNNASQADVALSLPGLGSGPSSLSLIASTGDDIWRSPVVVPVSGGSVSLPPLSVSTCYVPTPAVTGATLAGKKLRVYGNGFDDGASIFIDGRKLRTTADATDPPGSLIGRKASSLVAPGTTVEVTVRNADGTLSNMLHVTRPR